MWVYFTKLCYAQNGVHLNFHNFEVDFFTKVASELIRVVNLSASNENIFRYSTNNCTFSLRLQHLVFLCCTIHK